MTHRRRTDVAVVAVVIVLGRVVAALTLAARGGAGAFGCRGGGSDDGGTGCHA